MKYMHSTIYATNELLVKYAKQELDPTSKQTNK